MDFEPHGEIRIRWLANRLIVEVSGPVNLEGAIVFKQEIMRAIESAPHGSWTREEWLTNRDFLMTPDSLQCLQDSLIVCREKGCSRWCVFGGNSLTSAAFLKISDACQLPFVVCSASPDEKQKGG